MIPAFVNSLISSFSETNKAQIVAYVTVRFSGGRSDNALAETINGLYKTELVHRQCPWRNMQYLEMATLGWVDWFNTWRWLGPIGNIPSAEAEENFYAQRNVVDMVA